MEVRDVLTAALQDLIEAKIPEDLREIAFAKAVELRVDGNRLRTSDTSPDRRVDAGNGSSANSTLDRIAERLRLPSAVLADVFDAEDGNVQLVLGPGKLDQRKAAATKQIALLLAAGRQASGLEDWTPVSIIREMCDTYRKLDSPNFAATIKEMDDVFSFRGDGNRREVRMARPAWDEVLELVRQVTGEGNPS